MKFEATYTDTFCGDAKFTWVRRAIFHAPDGSPMSLLMRMAKKALGVSGRHRWKYKGHGCNRIDITGTNTCLFVDEWRDYAADAGLVPRA